MEPNLYAEFHICTILVFEIQGSKSNNSNKDKNKNKKEEEERRKRKRRIKIWRMNLCYISLVKDAICRYSYMLPIATILRCQN